MSLSTLKVFNDWVYSTRQEALTQQIQLFNAATKGGLVLKGGNNTGDYSEEATYARISGLVRRRNAYANTSVSAVDLAHLTNASVKVAGGTPPVNIDPHFWQWINRSPEEAGVVIGNQLAEDTVQDMVNTAVKALVPALGAQAAVVNDYSATGNASLAQIAVTASKFGDQSQKILCWLMHSKVWFDVFGAAITNANNLFEFGTIKVVQDGTGRPFVIADVPDLLNATPTPDVYRTLGLTSGAALVEQNDDYTENIQTTNGNENINRTFQAQWSYNLGLKGFTWDKTNGGASPTNAAIGTATNWDKTAGSDKNLAGVMLISQ